MPILPWELPRSLPTESPVPASSTRPCRSPIEPCACLTVGKSLASCRPRTRMLISPRTGSLLPSTLIGPVSLPPAMPNSSGSSVTTLSRNCQRVLRFSIGSAWTLDRAGFQPDVRVQAFPAVNVERCIGEDAAILARLVGADEGPEVRQVQDLGDEVAVHVWPLAAGVDLQRAGEVALTHLAG